MIEVIENFLSNSDLNYFESIIKNDDFHNDLFEPHVEKNYKNHYYRKSVDLPYEISLKFTKHIEKIYDLNVEVIKTWINYVFVKSNDGDNFHEDSCDVSFVIFLNDDFEGGELEFKSEETSNFQVKPKKNTAVVIKDKMKHKVNRVLSGNRYTLVCFLSLKEKRGKTTI